MRERAFVLRPLAELGAEVVTAAQLMAVADQAIECLQGTDWIKKRAYSAYVV